ncbi:short-chain dehydrogenase/reductase SDR [Rhizorhabdus wittichii RW1]|uniref:Short-chain dehydrogenase/reductase SDR n=1 Tax=Rhizorhabdus wittichii (strain DSM 6014 / CCUG 31198 / JCM 15750 / NBRC 105917 / EY 4224 / RW1) TaxID=392499 RepID=A0A9J9LG16_RHIWR|nr:short-chain dehydrogenase/reductase SDR [Rhizorhabdus wittichii RW1]
MHMWDDWARTARPLNGKGAIVTGAGRGCGRAIARGLAAAGARVCCAARSEKELAETVALIEADGGSAMAFAVDVTDLAAVEAMTETATAAFGGLDLLVLSHGVALAVAPIEGGDPADWRRTIEVNLIGSYHCIRAAVPPMKARGAGKIIVVGSGQGHNGTAATSAYASSKAGTWALTRSVAAELIGFNISVNELLPGNVRTQLYDETFAQTVAMTPDGGEPISAKRSHEWLKAPEDVVPLALFMACQPDVGPTAQSFSLMRRL